jgi:glutamate--cysteine ligase
MPEVFFEEDFGFERYVEWLLDVPMYFIVRDGRMVDKAGHSFRRFMADGEATVGDFEDHMTTAFTDVRVKRFLEMRGADAGRPEMMVAQSAFWVGLLYDEAALAAADALVRRRPWAEYVALRGVVPRLALDASFADGTARDLARDALAIARDGLRVRGHLDADGRDERCRLDPLLPMLDGGKTQAEHWLDRFANVWDGDASRIFAESRV